MLVTMLENGGYYTEGPCGYVYLSFAFRAQISSNAPPPTSMRSAPISSRRARQRTTSATDATRNANRVKVGRILKSSTMVLQLRTLGQRTSKRQNTTSSSSRKVNAARAPSAAKYSRCAARQCAKLRSPSPSSHASSASMARNGFTSTRVTRATACGTQPPPTIKNSSPLTGMCSPFGPYQRSSDVVVRAAADPV